MAAVCRFTAIPATRNAISPAGTRYHNGNRRPAVTRYLSAHPHTTIENMPLWMHTSTRTQPI